MLSAVGRKGTRVPRAAPRVPFTYAFDSLGGLVAPQRSVSTSRSSKQIVKQYRQERHQGVRTLFQMARPSAKNNKGY